MYKKFFIYNLIVIVVAMAVFFVIAFLTFNTYNVRENKDVINKYLDVSLVKYNETNSFEETYDLIYRMEEDIRLTVIDEEGTVLYDSSSFLLTDSHIDRPEITNLGEVSIRKSSNLDKEFMYVAGKALDSNYIRISMPLKTIHGRTATVYIMIGVELFLIFGISLLISFMFYKRISKPFNTALNDLSELAGYPRDYSSDDPSLISAQVKDIKGKLDTQFDVLKTEKEKLQEIIDFMPTAVLVVSKDNEVILTNKRYEELLKIHPQVELVLLSSKREEKETLGSNLYKLDEIKIESDWLKDGSIITLTDIKEKETMKLVKKDFFANASHELKSPLTIVKGFVEMVTEGIITDEEEVKKILKNAVNEIDNMDELITAMLEISYLESNKRQDLKDEICIKDTIKIVLEKLLPKAKKKNIQIKVDLDHSKTVIDPKHLEFLTKNILDNAIKYSHENGIVEIKLIDKMLVFKDNGMGIKEDEKIRIFERFYRSSVPEINKIPGSGLGLAIVKHIVNAYDIKIDLDSRENEGTTFTFWFK